MDIGQVNFWVSMDQDGVEAYKNEKNKNKKQQ